MKVLITEDADTPDEELLDRVKSAPAISAEDHVLAVTTAEPMHWTKGHESPFAVTSPATHGGRPEPIHRLVAFDFGAKRNILRSLVASGFDVTVVPADTPAEAVLERQPDAAVPQQRPGRPGVARLRGARGARPRRAGAGVRHLPRPSDPGAGVRRARPSR